MSGITIPPEAVEAAEDAYYEAAEDAYYEAVEAAEDAYYEALENNEPPMLAACLAMLKAWPGVATGAPWIIGVKMDAEAERLRAALRDARECVETWAGYASEYFRDKHDLAGDLARIDAALAAQPAPGGKDE